MSAIASVAINSAKAASKSIGPNPLFRELGVHARQLAIWGTGLGSFLYWPIMVGNANKKGYWHM